MIANTIYDCNKDLADMVDKSRKYNSNGTVKNATTIRNKSELEVGRKQDPESDVSKLLGGVLFIDVVAMIEAVIF